MDLNGQSILQRVYARALLANPKTLTIATDDVRIFEAAEGFGASVTMTKDTHLSGTERVAEVVARGGFSKDDIIVNVQGDEPLIAPALIRQVADSLANSNAPMATLCSPIDNEAKWQNPNVVKVVRDKHHQALYFSRSVIPFARYPTALPVLGHVGLYAYRAEFLLDMVSWPSCELEATESLEQLRVLWSGYRIQVDEACVAPLQDINTPEDLADARALC